ncbi:hypothetical protein Glove_151g85 [Diversispora epigaea]|uniref:Protein kinase domain-containing protein n=1 Tax=Diversispora epigaea TaxID=1348612 RepID=A0A397J206_9GLOM|nr:hypothetical protein Glove_151g85 [Diversispora epigaea]
MSFDTMCPECNQINTFIWNKRGLPKHFQNDFDKWTSGKNAIDKLIQGTQINTPFWNTRCIPKHFQNDFNKWTSRNNVIDKFIQVTQLNASNYLEITEWIPYNRFKDIRVIANGGFGTTYVAKWIDGPISGWDAKNQRWLRHSQRRYVALKKFDNNFTNLNEDFLNEMAIHLKTTKSGSLQFYGFTQNPRTLEYIMVLEYVFGGNLRDYLRNHFDDINWEKKLEYLSQLISNFERIHKFDIIHHNFHPGNILSNDFRTSLFLHISDFGLSKIIELNAKTGKRQIFGVLPYIAPEVLNGEEYTKAADVYSFGIVAYEMVTGFAPYHDIPHNIDLAKGICNGLRPKVPFHIPKLITRIIMRCWDARATHRPTFNELSKVFWKYYVDYKINQSKNKNEITIQIENSEKLYKNLKLTNPTPMNYKIHPKAIYTSRLLYYSGLPKPKNDKNFEKELEELTKSASALSIVAYKLSKLHGHGT